jgi:hypothetical protein
LRVVPKKSTERTYDEGHIEMPTADTTFQETQQEIVERWRAQELERAGFPEDTANELAMRTDVDLHAAINLIRRGCTPELAAQILL